jgi:hypothetical protein
VELLANRVITLQQQQFHLQPPIQIRIPPPIFNPTSQLFIPMVVPPTNKSIPDVATTSPPFSFSIPTNERPPDIGKTKEIRNIEYLSCY